MSQPSFVLIYDFFSTVGKHISHVHVSFIFANFKRRIELLCEKLVSFAFFKFFELILPRYQGPYSWHQVQTHATHHLQSDPSWISLQANHLNSSNHCIWKRRFWKLVRILHENRMKIKESSYLTSSSVAFTQRTSHKVPNVNNLMHAWGIRRNIVATSCTRRLLFYRWAGRPTVLTPVDKNFSRLLTLICFIWRWMSF